MRTRQARAWHWLLLLGLFSSMALLSQVEIDRSAPFVDGGTAGGPVASNANVQQPEHGLWAEYVEIAYNGSAIVQTKWQLCTVSDINATHYRVAITWLEDNTTYPVEGSFITNRTSGIVEVVEAFHPINGSKDAFFITNGTRIGDEHGPLMLYGSADTFNVTGAGTDPVFGDYAVLQGMATNVNTTGLYLNGSGMLLASMSLQSNGIEVHLILTRTNLFDITGYEPTFVSEPAWARVDIGGVNLENGLSEPFMTQTWDITPLGGTAVNLTVEVAGPERLTFNITTSTVNRLLYPDANAPDEFNETGAVMGLDFTYLDTSFLHGGKILAMSAFPGESVSVLPVVVAGQETFRGRTCWRLDFLPGARLNGTFWVDDETGVIMRHQVHMSEGGIAVIEQVVSTVLDPGSSVHVPEDGMWADYGGWVDNNQPFYWYLSYSDIDGQFYNVSWNMAQVVQDEDEDDVLAGRNGSLAVETRSANVVNSTDEEIFFFKFMQVPAWIANGTYVIIPVGPMIVMGQVTSTSDSRGQVNCIRISFSTLDGDEDILNGTAWFDAQTGLMHELEMVQNGTVSLSVKRLNSNPASMPADGGWSLANSFQVTGSAANGHSKHYETQVIQFSTSGSNGTHYTVSLDIKFVNMFGAVESEMFRHVTGDMIVQLATNWVVATTIPMWDVVNASFVGFNMMFLATGTPFTGDRVAAGFGPLPMLFLTYEGEATVKGVDCWEYRLDLNMDDRVNSSMYFEQSTGLLMQMNYTTKDEVYFMQVVRQNVTGPMDPIPVHGGAWMEVAGYQHEIVVTEGPYEEHHPMIMFIEVADNANGTFTMSQEGLFGHPVPATLTDLVDASTLSIIASSSPWIGLPFNESGYVGQSGFQIPVDASIGSMYLLNVGPMTNLPFVVTGTGTHHGRDVWVLELHEWFLAMGGGFVFEWGEWMIEDIHVEQWYYQDTGLFAKLFSNDTFTEAETYDTRTSEMVLTTIYSSFDDTPNPLQDVLWAEYVVLLQINGDDTPIEWYGYVSLMWDIDTYAGIIMIMRENMQDHMTWLSNNVSRFASEVDEEPLDDYLFIDGFRAPVTLEAGDSFVLTVLGMLEPAMVTGTMVLETWLGEREVIVIDSINGEYTAYYDRETGFLLRLFIDDSGARFILAGTNLLDPGKTIDLPPGTGASYQGYHFEDDGGGDTWAMEFSSSFEVIENDGLLSLLNITQNVYNGSWGWELHASFNCRMAQIIDSNVSLNDWSAFNPFALYAGVSIDDLYGIKMGPVFDVLTVTSLSTMHHDIECIVLQDATGLVTAYYRASDLLLFHLIVNNKTYGDTSHVMNLRHVDLLPYFVANFTFSPLDPDVTTAIDFTDLSWDDDRDIVSWYWDFGDGETVPLDPHDPSSANPTWQYTRAGTYTVTLRVVNELGLNRTFSLDVTVAGVAPGVVAGLVATPGNGQVDLAWDAPVDDGGLAITGYVVYWSSNNVTFTPITIGNVTTFLHGGRANQQVYYYTVAAINDAGTGPNSTVVPVLVGPPGEVTGVEATPGVGQITVSWSPAGTDLNYTIYASVNNEEFLEFVTVFNQTEYIHSGLGNGTTRYYRIAASNVVGQGLHSATVSATTWDVPGPALSMLAAPGSDNITVSWNAPLDNGGTPVLSYVVYISGNNVSFSPVPIGNVTTYDHTSLVPSSQYFYKVAAINAVGQGQNSSVVTTTVGSPGQVPDLVATPGNKNVSLSWGFAIGPNYMGYRVYRSIDGNSFTLHQVIASWLTLAFTDTGLEDGTTYHYKVAAYNAVGEGLNSSVANATTWTIPSEVNDLVASPGSRQVTLSWFAPDENGGTAIIRYNIYRRIEGVYTLVGNSTSTSFVDTGLNDGTSYTYRVRAVNAMGEGPFAQVTSAVTWSLPGQVTGLTATQVGAAIELSWTAPAVTGNTPITGYQVLRDGVLIHTAGAGTTSYTDTSVDGGVTYAYTVRAVNAVGAGPASTPVSASVVADAIIPGYPLAFTVLAAIAAMVLIARGPAKRRP